MKKALIAVCLLVVALVVLVGCSAGAGKDVSAEKRVTSAKIRYFDGSMDTVMLKEYSVCNAGTAYLSTEDGRKIVVGVNNVMIIEESEAQYNCVE